MRKVGIIGTGHVGATVALDIVQAGLVDELILIDKDAELAKAEEGDLRDSLPLQAHHTKVTAGTYQDLSDADIVLSTLGHIELIKPGGDRFTELQANLPEIKDVSEQLNAVNFQGILIATTNPNDVIVDLYSKLLNLPNERIFGTGTYLDTARLKRQVAEVLGIDGRSIEGYALGEHGNSQFAAWSTVRVGGRPFTEIAAEKGLKLADIEHAAAFGGFTVFDKKRYTNVAIAQATVALMNLVFSDAKNVAICSHYDPQFDGYISTPALIGKGGVESLIELPLTDEEKQKLQASADEIKQKRELFG